MPACLPSGSVLIRLLVMPAVSSCLTCSRLIQHGYQRGQNEEGKLEEGLSSDLERVEMDESEQSSVSGG